MWNNCPANEIQTAADELRGILQFSHNGFCLAKRNFSLRCLTEQFILAIILQNLVCFRNETARSNFPSRKGETCQTSFFGPRRGIIVYRIVFCKFKDCQARLRLTSLAFNALSTASIVSFPCSRAIQVVNDQNVL